MKILINAGPTRESIDPVRFITNHSSGKMGYALADAAVKAGHETTLISGPVMLSPPSGLVRLVQVTTAAEMAEAMKRTAAERIGRESVREGIIASGDQFICDGDVKRKIRKDFNASAVEMEGGAIAQIASMANIPFLVLRAISDLADGSATESFEVFEVETANLCATVLEDFLRSF